MIDDNYIISYYFDSKGRINGSRVSYLLEHKDLEDYEYLMNRYNDSSCINETLLRIFTHTEIRPVCRHCGGPVKFVGGKKTRMFARTCCKECTFGSSRSKLISKTYRERTGYDNPSQNPAIKKQKEDTSYKHFGVRHPMYLQEIKDKIFDTKLRNHGDGRYNNMPKNIETCNERYGCDYVLQVPEIRQRIRETTFDRYGVYSLFNLPSFQLYLKDIKFKKYNVDNLRDLSLLFLGKTKDTCNERYGCDWWQCSSEGHKILSERLSDPDVQNKIRTTKKLNGTIGNKSGQEDEIFRLLSIFFGEENIERQYNTSEYPYDCDFYITPLDLRIEYNGFFTHGFHPYDNTNEADRNKVKMYEEKNTKFSRNAKIIWTITDPAKRKCAQDNNLNFMELWPDTWRQIKRLKDDSEKIKVLTEKIDNYIGIINHEGIS